jgi:DnaK suppressor protein
MSQKSKVSSKAKSRNKAQSKSPAKTTKAKQTKPGLALKSVAVRTLAPSGPTTIERFRKELLKRQEDLKAYLKKIEEHGADMSSGPGDLADRSEEVEAWMTRESMNQHATLELRNIELALQRIDDGNFGVCQACEEAIPMKRLRARPNATLCLSCQEMNERQSQGLRKAAPTFGSAYQG